MDLEGIQFEISEKVTKKQLQSEAFKSFGNVQLVGKDFDVCKEEQHDKRTVISINQSGLQKIEDNHLSYWRIEFQGIPFSLKGQMRDQENEDQHLSEEEEFQLDTAEDINLKDNSNANKFFLTFECEGKLFFLYSTQHKQLQSTLKKSIANKKFPTLISLLQALFYFISFLKNEWAVKKKCQTKIISLNNYKNIAIPLDNKVKVKIREQIQKKAIYQNLKNLQSLKPGHNLIQYKEKYDLEILFRSHLQLLYEGIIFQFKTSKEKFIKKLASKRYTLRPIISLIGEFDMGKTFILNILNQLSLPSGIQHVTQSLGIVFGKEDIFIDLAGIQRSINPKEKVRLYQYWMGLFKFFQFYEQFGNITNETLKLLQTEKGTTDYLLMKISIELSQLILICVDTLTSNDQIYIQRVQDYIKQKFEKENKKIIVIHNLKKYQDPILILQKIYNDIGKGFDMISQETDRFKALGELVNYFSSMSNIELELFYLFNNPFSSYILSFYEFQNKEKKEDQNQKQILNDLLDSYANDTEPNEDLLKLKPFNKNIQDGGKQSSKKKEADKRKFIQDLVQYIYLEKFCIIEDKRNQIWHITICQYNTVNGLGSFQKMYTKIRQIIKSKEGIIDYKNGDCLVKILENKIKEEIKLNLNNKACQMITKEINKSTQGLFLKQKLNPNQFQFLIDTKNLGTYIFKITNSKSFEYYLFPINETEKNPKKYILLVATPQRDGIAVKIKTQSNASSLTIQCEREVKISTSQKKNIIQNSRIQWQSQVVDIYDILQNIYPFESIEFCEQKQCSEPGFTKYEITLAYQQY